jgi:hypothetical protein
MRLSIEPLYAVFSRLRLTATPTTADLGCYSRAPNPRRPGIATGRKHAATADAKREQYERSQRSDRRDINTNLSAATITTRRRRPSEGFAPRRPWEVGAEVALSADASACAETHASKVVVAAAPLAVSTMLASVEVDDPWLAELRNIIEAKLALPLSARCAVGRVVQTLILEGCTPWQAAQAESLSLRR